MRAARTGLQSRPYPQASYLRQMHAAAMAVTLSAEQRQGLAGPQIGAALQQRRLAAVTDLRERLATASRADPEP